MQSATGQMPAENLQDTSTPWPRHKKPLMDQFDKITDGLMYFVPAFLVMLVLFWLMKKNNDRDHQLRLLDLRKNLQKETIQLRLQAYERLVLFLERISPNSLLPRMHKSGMSAAHLHNDLLITVRTEFEHNFSQQLYVSRKAWEQVRDAKDQMLRVINTTYHETGERATGMQLSTRIVDYFVEAGDLPTQRSIDFLKNEARQLFG